jgi:hypothetical protein
MSGEALQLEEPLKEGGIRSVNFFNGRLLTAKDLSREQQARREWDARLGLAIGDGVAFGLETARDADLDAPAAPVLRVKAGLALNRAGQALRLSLDTSVALTRRFDGASGAACDCVFANCNPLGDGSYVAGAGVYLLTIAPAQMSEGRAPTNGLDPTNVRCNTDVTVDGLQFRLLSLNPQRYTDLDVASTQFRNRIAYRCFGLDARAANAIDPLRSDPQHYGLVDELRGTSLSDCDVPLALLYWTAAGLQFVDMWAVRRRLLAPDALSAQAFQARGRRLVEAEAMCAQFQHHLADLLAASPAPAALQARSVFRHLPPFGIVPLAAGPLRGFSDAVFFTGVPRVPVVGLGQSTLFIDARLLSVLQEQSLAHAPTDLTQGEFLRVYRPWQGTQATLSGTPVQPVLAFTSGLSPELATARFDMARADFSNFANCCSAA